MMNLNLANVKAQEEGKPFQMLPVGGYNCMIMGVKDDPTRQSLALDVEIADGEFSGYYTKSARDGNVRYGKLFVGYANDQYNSIGKFKAFVTALEHSNNGFRWDGVNEQLFNAKRIGVVFGEREYIGNDGNVHVGVNPRYPISLERLANNDYSIPRRKTVAVPAETTDAQTGFTAVQEKLPWE